MVHLVHCGNTARGYDCRPLGILHEGRGNPTLQPLICDLLQEAGKPLGSAQLRQRLADAGRPTGMTSVYAAVMALVRKGAVRIAPGTSGWKSKYEWNKIMA